MQYEEMDNDKVDIEQEEDDINIIKPQRGMSHNKRLIKEYIHLKWKLIRKWGIYLDDPAGIIHF